MPQNNSVPVGDATLKWSTGGILPNNFAAIVLESCDVTPKHDGPIAECEDINGARIRLDLLDDGGTVACEAKYRKTGTYPTLGTVCILAEIDGNNSVNAVVTTNPLRGIKFKRKDYATLGFKLEIAPGCC